MIKLIASSILVALFVFFAGAAAMQAAISIKAETNKVSWELYVCAICAGLIWFLY
jgi:uncharacterized protein YabE (DUF348 family)